MARVLGIDIDGEALRGVVVRTTLRRVELEHALQIPLSEGPGSPGRHVELSEAARSLLAALPAPPDAVIASVSGEAASLRTIDLPASAAKRIAEILPFEMETLLPFDPKDAVLDHQALDVRDGRLRVLAAAVPRERVRAALAELTDLGLEPRELAVGAASLDGLVPLLPDLAGVDATLLVELALDRTDLCLLEHGRCALARTISLGARSFPRGGDDLVREIQRSLAGHRAAGGDAPVRAVLCGAGAAADGMAPWLARKLGFPVAPIALPSPPGAVLPPGPVFARAAALAARGAQAGHRINLCKAEFAPSRGATRLVDHLQLAVTCVVVVVMAATFSLKARQSLLAGERTALRAQLSEVTKDVFGTASTDPERVDALIRNRESGDPLPRFDAFDALAVISASVPEDITHEVRRLRIDVADEKREGTVELQGTLQTIEQRDAIITRLSQHECIKDIEPGRVTPAGGPDRISYQIEATLRCPGAEPPGKTKKHGSAP